MASVDSSLASQCMDFCQALASQNKSFTFSLTIGSTFALHWQHLHWKQHCLHLGDYFNQHVLWRQTLWYAHTVVFWRKVTLDLLVPWYHGDWCLVPMTHNHGWLASHALNIVCQYFDGWFPKTFHSLKEVIMVAAEWNIWLIEASQFLLLFKIMVSYCFSNLK